MRTRNKVKAHDCYEHRDNQNHCHTCGADLQDYFGPDPTGWSTPPDHPDVENIEVEEIEMEVLRDILSPSEMLFLEEWEERHYGCY